MLIPYGSNAPIYYRPFATVGLIAVNVGVFLLQWNSKIDASKWVLLIGDGIHPIQWLTGNFLHAGWLHLLSNMIFLWVFGLIVEGKLGSLRFLGVYLGLGILESALEQILFLNTAKSASLGASSILYGLLGISAVWAPKNEVRFLLFFVRATFIELSVQTTALLYIVLDCVVAFIGMGMGNFLTTSTIHLAGAFLGIVAGVVLLKRGIVDCENWDWFSVRAGRHIPESAYNPRAYARQRPEGETTSEEDRQVALELIRENLAAGDPMTAWETYLGAAGTTDTWQLGEKDSRAMLIGLRDAKAWQPFVALARKHITRFPARSASIQLGLAEYLASDGNRPSQALRIIEKLSDTDLTPAEITNRDRIRADAERRAKGGALEFADE